MTTTATAHREHNWLFWAYSVIFGVLLGGKLTMPASTGSLLGIAVIIAFSLVLLVPAMQRYRDRHGVEVMRGRLWRCVVVYLASAVVAWGLEMLFAEALFDQFFVR